MTDEHTLKAFDAIVVAQIDHIAADPVIDDEGNRVITNRVELTQTQDANPSHSISRS